MISLRNNKNAAITFAGNIKGRVNRHLGADKVE
jgi:hypothetical protein